MRAREEETQTAWPQNVEPQKESKKKRPDIGSAKLFAKCQIHIQRSVMVKNRGGLLW